MQVGLRVIDQRRRFVAHQLVHRFDELGMIGQDRPGACDPYQAGFVGSSDSLAMVAPIAAMKSVSKSNPPQLKETCDARMLESLAESKQKTSPVGRSSGVPPGSRPEESLSAGPTAKCRLS